MEWLWPYLSRTQAAGFSLTAFGVWIYFAIPDDRWLYLVVLAGFVTSMTDVREPRSGGSPSEKSQSVTARGSGLYWPGYVVFLLAMAFALILRISRDGLPIALAARIAGLLILVSGALILLRTAVHWFESRRGKMR